MPRLERPSNHAFTRLQLLTSQGATSTLDYMQQYWLNDDGTNEELWEVRTAFATQPLTNSNAARMGYTWHML
jgi:hypothetical protein